MGLDRHEILHSYWEVRLLENCPDVYSSHKYLSEKETTDLFINQTMLL